jgi:hypothetical protein
MTGQSNDSLFAMAMAARSAGGRGVAADLLEALRLRASSESLSFREYFFYRLYAPSMTRDERRRFVGWRREVEIDRSLNKAGWRAVANDKLLFYSTLAGFGLPFPRLRAIYSQHGRYLEGVPRLNSESSLAALCRDPGSFPVFAKPLMGSYGRGAFSIMGYDATDDALLIGDGQRKPVRDAVAQFMEPACGGYLFQALVEPHPATEAVCGPKITSARVVVLLGPQGPVLFRCVWKIPTGRNMSDNFMHGETGNLLGHVDTQSGAITRVISGVGLGLRELRVHPDTGVRFDPFVLPCWPEVRDLCLRAAPCYPGLRLQHWDIALSRDGPQILEVNVEGSLDLHQLAGGKGVMDEDLVAAMRGAASRRGPRK